MLIARRISIHNFLSKNKIHILLWAGMIAYLFGAQPVYLKYFLPYTSGRPSSIRLQIPDKPTRYIKFGFDNLSDMQNGLYRLNGSSYFKAKGDNPRFDRFVVLQSDEHVYFFLLSSDRPDFYMPISRYFIEPGVYRLGLVYRRKSNQSLYYKRAGLWILCTPNSLQLLEHR